VDSGENGNENSGSIKHGIFLDCMGNDRLVKAGSATWSCVSSYYPIVLWALAQLFEALRYKTEGRGFDSRWCHWNFSLT